MYQRFCREKPATPGNSFWRSRPSRSITELPHFSAFCRSTICLPMSQYKRISSWLIVRAAWSCAERMRAFNCSSACA
jgi:hypothetical protein